MKLFRKLLLLGVIGLVVLIVGIGIAATLLINSAARKGIEYGANTALGVNTKLEKVNIGLLSGKFQMGGLNVGNPQGFPSDHFLNLGDAKVQVSLSSLTKDVIELPEFSMDALDVNLERRSGKSNYQVILDNLAKLSDPNKKPAPTEPGKKGSEKKLIIKQVTLKNITIHADMVDASTPGLGQLAKVTVPIPEIKLQNVGQTGSGVGGSGVTISELSSIVVQAIMAAVAEKGGVLPEQLLGELKGQLGNLGGLKNLTASFVTQVGGNPQALGQQFGAAVQNVGEGAKKTVQDITGKLGPAGKDAGDAAGKALDKAADKLKGLLPGTQEQPKNPK